MDLAAEIDALAGPGAADGIDFEVLESAVRRQALGLAARLVERRLNADLASDAIALTVDPTQVSEGDVATAVTVTASLNGATRTDAPAVSVAVSGKEAEETANFAPVPDFVITIAAGNVSGTGMFTLTPVDDTLDEAEETLLIEGTADLPVTETTVSLVDNDTASDAIALTVDPTRCRKATVRRR